MEITKRRKRCVVKKQMVYREYADCPCRFHIARTFTWRL
ncbi:hypothetical protein HMPREF9406_2052 [Clostridium sp. HGF2]|nr:hypothetical protein HMPREF9406_2052 [Clostridium sp. HGF2]EQJ53863.1 hypothetical protein QSI_3337 [Clostridioides difficile P28]